MGDKDIEHRISADSALSNARMSMNVHKHARWMDDEIRYARERQLKSRTAHSSMQVCCGMAIHFVGTTQQERDENRPRGQRGHKQ